MNRQERAERVVKMVGVVLLVLAAAWLVPVALLVIRWTTPGRGGAASWRLGELAAPLLTGLLGGALLAWAGAVVRLMRLPAMDGVDTPLGRLLRAGLAVLGMRAMLGLLSYGAMGASGRPFCLLGAAACGLEAAALLAPPRGLTAWLGDRLRAVEGWTLAGALGTGVALVALFGLARRWEYLAILPAMHADLGRGWSAAQSQAWWASQLGVTGLGLAVALLLLGFCGGAGRWLARGAPESERPVVGSLSGGNWAELASSAAALLLVPPFVQLLAASVAGLTPALDRLSFAVPAVTIGLMVAGARAGAAIGRLVYGAAEEGPGDRSSLLIAVEVAVTVLACYGLLAVPTFSASGQAMPTWRLVTVGAILLMRGDIARWCVWRAGEVEDGQRRRPAAHYPWLVLLGVALLERSALMGALRGLTLAGLLPEEPRPVGPGVITVVGWPPFCVPLVAGLLLILARRPLSRLLSYGPLLHRRRGAGAGAAE